jgi:adenine-specific DNA-methyltransferase
LWARILMAARNLAELEARKSRGAFFTPPSIAVLLTEWAIRDESDRVLEPSCGEAAFLSAAVGRLRSLGAAATLAGRLVGVDIHPEAVAVAGGILAELGAEAELSVTDFFDFRAGELFDAVIGNPPYVRYQTFTGTARAKGREAALAQGVRLQGLASSWAAFTIHAASFLKFDGRLALVLPAELLSVNYAGPVRRYLMNRFGRVRLILFDERVFPGVLAEVVLLLADGQGPTSHCELIQARNLEDLGKLTPQTWEPKDADEKWTAGLLPADASGIYNEVLDAGRFEKLEAWGGINLGMVTGNNRYFTLSALDVQKLGLKTGELMRICPPGSRHLRGLGFTTSAWDELLEQGSAGYLFDPKAQPSEAAQKYIASGEKLGVHKAYKCRVRSPWWTVPRVAVPDAFFTYMNHDTPRIATNRAGVGYLNSVHGITFARERRQIGMDLLPIASLNSFTLLGSELVGRSYGGGILKLEPKEADRLPVPSVAIVEAAADELRALRPQLASELRQGKLLKVVARVDRVLRPHLELSGATLKQIRAAREVLFSRRVARSQTEL